MSLIINGNATINKPSTFNSNLRYGNSDILTNDAKSNELVTANWVKENYGVAPSPYIHTFTGTSTTIPYEKIRGLKWVKFKFSYSVGYTFTQYGSCSVCTYTSYANYCCRDYSELFRIKFPFPSFTNFAFTGCKVTQLGCSMSSTIYFSYNIKTGLFSVKFEKDVAYYGFLNFSLNKDDF